MSTLPDRALPPAEALETWLGPNWLVAVAGAPPHDQELSADERATFDRLPDVGPRRRQWLAGRAALKPVLRRLGLSDDTAHLRWPHPRISLTHCGSATLAVGTRKLTSTGVGVDVERMRPTRPEAARFFLRSPEREWLAASYAQARDLEALRMWTTKEAVFKADPENDGRQLREYVLDKPYRWVGIARHQLTTPSRPPRHFHYRTIRTQTHLISVAQTVGGRREDDPTPHP